MNKLSKDQRDEYATAFAILALYDGGVRHFLCFCSLPIPMKKYQLQRNDIVACLAPVG
jgi:hypothetical protein